MDTFTRRRPHVLRIDFIKSPLIRTLIYDGLIGSILIISPAKFADFISIRF